MAAQQLVNDALAKAVPVAAAAVPVAVAALPGPPVSTDAALRARLSAGAYAAVQQLLAAPKVKAVKTAPPDKVWTATLKVDRNLPAHQGRWFAWDAAPLAGKLTGSPWAGQHVTAAVAAQLRAAADVDTAVRVPAGGANGRVVFMLSDAVWSALLQALPRPPAPPLPPPPPAPHVPYAAGSGPSSLRADTEYLNFLRLGRGVVEATVALRPLVAAVLEQDYVTVKPAVIAALEPWCRSAPTCPYHGTAGLSTNTLQSCDYCKPWVDVLVTRHVEQKRKDALRNLHFGNCVPSLLCDPTRGPWEVGKVYVCPFRTRA